MRLVVLTNGNAFARILLEQLIRERSAQMAKIIVVTGDYRGRTGFAALRWLARVTTWPYLVFKIAVLVAGRRGRVAALARQHGIATEEVRDVSAVQQILKEVEPDLLISVSCPQVIPEATLQLARKGGINIHASLLPRYRGLAPYYWVLAEGEARTGITVHFMTRRVDEGNILGVATVPIEARDSAFALFARLAAAGSPLLADAVTRALAGEAGEPMDGPRSYRSHPDFASYLRLRRNGHRLVRLREWLRACL